MKPTLFSSLFFFVATSWADSPGCDPNKGLSLLSSANPPMAEVNAIIIACGNQPFNVQVLLLRGLYERKQNHYADAIYWLKKAKNIAAREVIVPALELAITYEWNQQLNDAQAIYEEVLKKFPQDRATLLGLGRIHLAKQEIEKALPLYKQLLTLNPNDLDALNGMGRASLVYQDYASAKDYFQKAQKISPNNQDTKRGLDEVQRFQGQQVQKDSNLEPIFACDPANGLKMVNQAQPPFLLIQQMLLSCAQQKISNEQVLLLHGLMARAQKNYPEAIAWLQKTRALSPPDNNVAALELAVTYEWAEQLDKAKAIYQILLVKQPQLQAALSGLERIQNWQKKRPLPAQSIIPSPCDSNKALALLNQDNPPWHKINFYAKLCQQLNSKDPQWLLLQGLIERKQHHYAKAISILEKAKALSTKDNPIPALELAVTYEWAHDLEKAKTVYLELLQVQPHLQAALLGKKRVETWLSQEQHLLAKPSPCDTVKALSLVSDENPSWGEINHILSHCQRMQVQNDQVYLLKGLIARKQKNYEEAIALLLKAQQLAPVNDTIAAQELALTYEWALQNKKARALYEALLQKNPNLRPALLGIARIALSEYRSQEAYLIYKNLLAKNPHDVEALNGLGRTMLVNKRFNLARFYFNEALRLSPGNEESLLGLKQLDSSTRYLLSINQGQYRVLDQYSNSTVIYGSADINATDKAIGIATHNSKQLQLDLTVEPTVLPSNAVYVGYQRQVPNRYGFEVHTDFRQHNYLPTETRAGASANLYVLKRLQGYGGFWNGFGSPWQNKLYFSGFTLYTDLPFNFSTTGFFGFEQLGGRNTTYSFDLSKEFTNNFFYNLGTTYNSTQKFWGYHGRFILPTFKNQALEGAAEYYNFNNIIIFSLGWRFYWA